jgi:hypothetical protein
LQDLSAYCAQRHDFLDRPSFDGFLGHAENDALFFILRNRACAGLAHLEQAGCAIVAHAGHDASERIGTSELKALLQDSLPPSFGAFFKPWENPEYAEFFNSDIGKDIRARWPAATQKFHEEAESVEQLLGRGGRAIDRGQSFEREIYREGGSTHQSRRSLLRVGTAS